MQLVSSLKGLAVEVLSQLTPLQRTSYDCVVAVEGMDTSTRRRLFRPGSRPG